MTLSRFQVDRSACNAHLSRSSYRTPNQHCPAIMRLSCLAQRRKLQFSYEAIHNSKSGGPDCLSRTSANPRQLKERPRFRHLTAWHFDQGGTTSLDGSCQGTPQRLRPLNAHGVDTKAIRHPHETRVGQVCCDDALSVKLTLHALDVPECTVVEKHRHERNV